MTDINSNTENSEARAAVDGVMSSTKDTAAQLGAKAKETLSAATSAAKDSGAKINAELNNRVDEGSNGAAESLSKLADKLAEAKPDLANTWLGPMVEQTETSIRSVASYLHDSKPDAYFTDFAAFARKNPAMAVGGAVAIGFLLSRAAKVAAKDLSA